MHARGAEGGVEIVPEVGAEAIDGEEHVHVQ